MSDFYAGRRTLLADLGGLAGLGIGALVAAMSVWKVLATGFRTGEMERAFTVFLAMVVGAAALGGAAGLGVGRWAGRRWEQRHRSQRTFAPEPPPDVATVPASPTIGTMACRPLSAEAQRVAVLVHPSPPPGAVAWGAWDGPRMVAVLWVSDTTPPQIVAATAEQGYDVPRLAAEVLAAAVVRSSSSRENGGTPTPGL